MTIKKLTFGLLFIYSVFLSACKKDETDAIVPAIEKSCLITLNIDSLSGDTSFYNTFDSQDRIIREQYYDYNKPTNYNIYTYEPGSITMIEYYKNGNVFSTNHFLLNAEGIVIKSTENKFGSRYDTTFYTYQDGYLIRKIHRCVDSDILTVDTTLYEYSDNNLTKITNKTGSTIHYTEQFTYSSFSDNAGLFCYWGPIPQPGLFGKGSKKLPLKDTYINFDHPYESSEQIYHYTFNMDGLPAWIRFEKISGNSNNNTTNFQFKCK